MGKWSGTTAAGDEGVLAGVGDLLTADGAMRADAENLPVTGPEVAGRGTRRASKLAQEKLGGKGGESGGGERR
jgi:hypothetical protein